MKKNKVKIIISILLLVILFYLIFNLRVFNKDSLMEVIAGRKGNNNFFAIFTIFSSILMTFFVPLSWVAFFSAYFFGMGGFFSIFTSAVISSILSFSIARLFSRNILSMVTGFYNRKERKYDLDYVINLIESYGMSYIIYLRNTPFIPFSLTSYIAGASNIRFKDHLMGTAIGLVPNLLIGIYYYISIMNITNSIKGVILASLFKICQLTVLFYFFKKNFK